VDCSQRHKKGKKAKRKKKLTGLKEKKTYRKKKTNEKKEKKI
jgi:hypothetical protein